MKWRKRIRCTLMMLAVGGVGLLEAYYLPRYGIEWLLVAIGVTVVLASLWFRSSQAQI